jgi:subtilisin family serine protease
MRTWGLCVLAALALTAVPAAGSPAVSSAKLASRLAELSTSGHKVRVMIEARPGRTAAAVSAAMRAGAKLEAVYHGLVQVLAPASSLERLAASPAVSFVRPPLLHVPEAVTGQEVAASRASTLQNGGLSGAGVKIAIIDVGFAGEKEAEHSGELSDGTPVYAQWCSDVNGSHHGTAVAEIVHDMAPGANLYLLCIDSEATLALAVDWAISQGIPLINHSVAWLSGGEGDGVHNRIDRVSPDDVAHKAYNNGVLWVGAAGNFALSHWAGTFSNPDGNRWENFSGADEGNDFIIPPRAKACVSLVWNEWPQTDQDFNVYMIKKDGPHNPDNQSALVSGEDQQRPGHQGTPSEEACYVNPSGAPLTVYVAINNIDATRTPRFDLFVTQGALQYYTPQGSVAQPAESPWALAVGAVCWKDYAFRAYSSQGPTIDGRTKPDIVGYDGVSTATFGPTSSCTGGFMGTSAATPGVTGAAALLLQQNNQLAGHPTQLTRALEAHAFDLGAPGKDNVFGVGALCLTSCAPPPPPPPPAPPPPPPPPRLVLVGFSTTPKHSKAGKPFAARIAVARSDTGARVRSGSVLCAANAASTPIRRLSAGFREGLARCLWHIPASATGKMLRGSVGLSYGGLRIRRSFAQRIG